MVAEEDEPRKGGLIRSYLESALRDSQSFIFRMIEKAAELAAFNILSLVAGLGHSEQFAHLLVEEAFAGTVGLHPFTIDYELRDGAPAGLADNFFCGTGGIFDVDLFV